MLVSVSLITSILTTLGASHALEQGAYCPPVQVCQNHQAHGWKVVGNRTTRRCPDDRHGSPSSETNRRVFRSGVPLLRKPLGDGGTFVSSCSFRITEPPRCSRGACESPRAIDGMGESIPYAPSCGPRVSSVERSIERTNRVEVFPERIRSTRCRHGLGLAIRIERNVEVKHQIRARVHRIRKIGHRGSRRLRYYW